MRFWRAGTGHVRGGGQYDLMESVSAKGGFEPASELTSKQVRSKIESYGFGLWLKLSTGQTQNCWNFCNISTCSQVIREEFLFLTVF